MLARSETGAAMPTNAVRILKLCEELDAASLDDLRKMDRGALLAAQAVLKALKRDVDRTLLRLSFLDAQSLN